MNAHIVFPELPRKINSGKLAFQKNVQQDKVGFLFRYYFRATGTVRAIPQTS